MWRKMRTPRCKSSVARYFKTGATGAKKARTTRLTTPSSEVLHRAVALRAVQLPLPGQNRQKVVAPAQFEGKEQTGTWHSGHHRLLGQNQSPHEQGEGYSTENRREIGVFTANLVKAGPQRKRLTLCAQNPDFRGIQRLAKAPV